MSDCLRSGIIPYITPVQCYICFLHPSHAYQTTFLYWKQYILLLIYSNIIHDWCKPRETHRGRSKKLAQQNPIPVLGNVWKAMENVWDFLIHFRRRNVFVYKQVLVIRRFVKYPYISFFKQAPNFLQFFYSLKLCFYFSHSSLVFYTNYIQLCI